MSQTQAAVARVRADDPLFSPPPSQSIPYGRRRSAIHALGSHAGTIPRWGQPSSHPARAAAATSTRCGGRPQGARIGSRSGTPSRTRGAARRSWTPPRMWEGESRIWLRESGTSQCELGEGRKGKTRGKEAEQCGLGLWNACSSSPPSFLPSAGEKAVSFVLPSVASYVRSTCLLG